LPLENQFFFYTIFFRIGSSFYITLLSWVSSWLPFRNAAQIPQGFFATDGIACFLSPQAVLFEPKAGYHYGNNIFMKRTVG